MARNEQLIRQHKLLQLLEASRYGKRLDELRDDLVSDLGLSSLSERTVRRDLEALQAAGFDVDVEDSPRGVVWKMGDKLKKIPKVEASATELLALSMVRELLTPLAGTPYWQGIETLWQKMRDTLPEPVWKHFDKQRKSLVVLGSPAKSYAEQQGVIATINRAILQNRVLQIAYRSNDETEASLREVEPYALVYYRGSLYLVAQPKNAPAASEYRHYKLDRFKKATALDDYFTPRPDFDADKHFGSSLGIYKTGKPQRFEIRLADHVVAWVSETPWHPKQEIVRRKPASKPLGSGDSPDEESVLVLPAAYEEEIIPRVLALGEAAEILAPEPSRLAIQQLVTRLDQIYRGAKAGA